ncbi:Uu.00g054920.m01.CDS01 [Anthostomella pinea]|uniref:Uu.00g054920.m01.CDS01 n=1 Tax=Anthostomella pinea TaxID=933095 RepID=A0AAI8VWQ6_9PEZI|nr:Uu.00g054920.m01.CDS01 [Anthostomella pinea]
MSQERPEPPSGADSPEELVAHVTNNPSDWLLYLCHINGYVKEITYLEVKKLRLLDAATPAIQTPRPVSAATPSPPAEQPADSVPGSTVLALPVHSGSSHLSEKILDLKEFDGSRSDLRRFTQQIYGKITANADRFPTVTARLTYVAGRLTGKAYELILPKTRYGVPNFLDYLEMLAYLENAFGDPDRIQNAQNKLYQLKQRNQDFSTFFSEF